MAITLVERDMVPERPEMPAELKACEACGHEPDPGKRLAWLAGCLESHAVYVRFNPLYLTDEIVHAWEEEATVSEYSATRFDGYAQATTETMLAWLDDVHAGKTPRHTKHWAAEIEFDDWSPSLPTAPE